LKTQAYGAPMMEGHDKATIAEAPLISTANFEQALSIITGKALELISLIFLIS
jgi:hypothetical protein